jgi:hypothetical protein
LITDEFSALPGARSKSRPVQRATPPCVPIHNVPSVADDHWPTLACGRLRGSLGRGMKRVKVLPSVPRR